MNEQVNNLWTQEIRDKSQNWNNVVNKKPSGDFIGVIVAEVSQDGFLFYKYL